MLVAFGAGSARNAQSERGIRVENTISIQQDKGRDNPATDWVASGLRTGGTHLVCSLLSRPEEGQEKKQDNEEEEAD